MLNEAAGHDLGHDLVGIVRPLAALEAQREGECVGDVASLASMPRMQKALR